MVGLRFVGKGKFVEGIVCFVLVDMVSVIRYMKMVSFFWKFLSGLFVLL